MLQLHHLSNVFSVHTVFSAEVSRVFESPDDPLYRVTIRAISEATPASLFIYRAVLDLGRGGRPWSLASPGLCLALLGGSAGPSDGCGPLPRRKCSQTGIDSSTDAQYLVYDIEKI